MMTHGRRGTVEDPVATDDAVAAQLPWPTNLKTKNNCLLNKVDCSLDLLQMAIVPAKNLVVNSIKVATCPQ